MSVSDTDGVSSSFTLDEEGNARGTHAPKLGAFAGGWGAERWQRQKSQLFFEDFIYLSPRDAERGRDAGRGRGRLPAGTPTRDSIP